MARFQNGMRPIHPGEILREEYLVPLAMTERELAAELHVDEMEIAGILQGEKGVSPALALRLARYFGGDAETWLNLQQAYDLKTAQRDVGDRICAEVSPRRARAA